MAVVTSTSSALAGLVPCFGNRSGQCGVVHRGVFSLSPLPSEDGSEQLRRRPKNRPFLSCFHGQNLYTSSRASQYSRRKCSAKALTAPAGVRSPRPENVAGDFFVDHTCIDCDTCRWMAPEVFSRIGDMSAVHHQPGDKEERLRGLQALLACPTASIHTTDKPTDISSVHDTFPIPVDPLTLPGVFHCGYHSKLSYGAASYLIQRPGGNILVDSPRYTPSLAKKFEAMGGVRYLFLTHKDDVADHAKWALHFNCQRILHVADREPSTADVEMPLEGSGPWSLGEDIDLIHVEGHTRGSVCLLYRPLRVLFSGDHIARDEGTEEETQFTLFKQYCLYQVPQQVESVRKLLNVAFVWLLPGHGRRYHFADIADKNKKLNELIQKEEANLLTTSK